MLQGSLAVASGVDVRVPKPAISPISSPSKHGQTNTAHNDDPLISRASFGSLLPSLILLNTY